MATLNKILRFFLPLCALHASTVMAAQTTTMNFNGSIIAGTCDITLDATSVQFGVHRASDFSAPGMAVSIQPLEANIECTANAPAPEITLSGSPGTTTPFGGVPVFRDNAGSTAQGVGFMVREDAFSGDFYNDALALSSTTKLVLPAIIAGSPGIKQKFKLGLVRPSWAGAPAVTGGNVQAKLTFAVVFK